MKKIVLLICVFIFLQTMPFAVVQAETYDDDDNPYMSNVVYLDTKGDEVSAFTSYSREDDKTYLFVEYADRFEAYDYLSGELIVTITFHQDDTYITPLFAEPQLSFPDSIMASPDDYESWTSYVYVTRDDMHIDNLTGLTVSILVTYLTNHYGYGWAGYLTALAQAIINASASDVYALIYKSTNLYCSILIKEKYVFYKNNGTYIRTEYKNPRWLGNPYDYTQPYACRVLEERYAY